MCSFLIVYFGFSVLFSIVAYQFRLGGLVFVVVFVVVPYLFVCLSKINNVTDTFTICTI